MPCIAYVPKTFSPRIQEAIDSANEIIAEYQADGYQLTLRQLYYQFVSRGLLPNKKQSYDNLGTWISDARLAGQIDWKAIEDRTRNVRYNNHWENPSDLLNWAADEYGFDLWENQPERVEIWVEKEALAGVIERPSREWDVSWFCCRGYVSQSEMWRAALRLMRYQRSFQDVTVIHLGDHDPSGIDMTRDIKTKLGLFGVSPVNVERIALNMDQIEELQPPPAPAKVSDSRFESYAEQFGTQSWELDALDPAYLNRIITNAIQDHCDIAKLEDERNRQDEERDRIREIAEEWEAEL
jgi:hypothetical protein